MQSCRSAVNIVFRNKHIILTGEVQSFIASHLSLYPP